MPVTDTSRWRPRSCRNFQGQALPAERLPIVRVRSDAAAPETRPQSARSPFERVGAEQPGRSVQIAQVRLEPRFETFQRRPEQLQPCGDVPVAAQRIRFPSVAVGNMVAAPLDEQRGAARQNGRNQRPGQGAFEIDAGEAAQGQPPMRFRLPGGRRGLHLDEAGRGVAAEQRALRPAQHLNALHVVDGGALEQRVFQHQAIVHDRHRLRGVQIEVLVAKAANEEIGEDAPVGRSDLQAWNAAAEEPDVAP